MRNYSANLPTYSPPCTDLSTYLPLISSYSPLKVEPKIGHTPIVFSSIKALARSAVRTKQSGETSAKRASTSK